MDRWERLEACINEETQTAVPRICLRLLLLRAWKSLVTETYVNRDQVSIRVSGFGRNDSQSKVPDPSGSKKGRILTPTRPTKFILACARGRRHLDECCPPRVVTKPEFMTTRVFPDLPYVFAERLLTTAYRLGDTSVTFRQSELEPSKGFNDRATCAPGRVHIARPVGKADLSDISGAACSFR